jgi:hypothetical protein
MSTLQWLEQTTFSDWVLTSFIGFPLMLSLHAVGLAISMGLLLVLNLRMLGLFRFISYIFFKRALLLAWTGLGINFLSGTILFVPRGVEYVGDTAFLTKMVLIIFGLFNTVWLHRQLVRESGLWASDLAAPIPVRFWAATSMVIWFGVIASGRLIAYVD